MTETQRIWKVKDTPGLSLVKLEKKGSSVQVFLSFFFPFQKLKWEVNGTCGRQVSAN